MLIPLVKTPLKDTSFPLIPNFSHCNWVTSCSGDIRVSTLCKKLAETCDYLAKCLCWNQMSWKSVARSPVYNFCNSTAPVFSAQCLALWFQSLVLHVFNELAQMAKNLPAVQEAQVWSLGWEAPLGKGMPGKSHGQRRLQPTDYGVAKSGTRLSD